MMCVHSCVKAKLTEVELCTDGTPEKEKKNQI